MTTTKTATRLAEQAADRVRQKRFNDLNESLANWIGLEMPDRPVEEYADGSRVQEVWDLAVDLVPIVQRMWGER